MHVLTLKKEREGGLEGREGEGQREREREMEWPGRGGGGGGECVEED